MVTVSVLGSLSSRPFTELTVTWYILPGIMSDSKASNTLPSTVTIIGLPVEDRDHKVRLLRAPKEMSEDHKTTRPLAASSHPLTSFKWHVGDAIVIYWRARHGPVNYSRGVGHFREAESFRGAQCWQNAKECAQTGGQKKRGELKRQ